MAKAVGAQPIVVRCDRLPGARLDTNGDLQAATGGRVPDARRGLWPLASAALLALALLALNVRRAASQAITHDEALTVLWYLTGPLKAVFTSFQANNHVLHTALAWCSVHALGLSELTLRLPSLLGGALCLAAALGLLHALLGPRWMLVPGFGLLALNPLLLDFLSAARGYGLALGLMLAAALLLARALQGDAPGRGRLALASLAAGLSVAANLTLAPACLGLLATACWLLPAGSRGARTLAALLLPGAAVAAALLARPLLAATPGSFFVGLPTLAESSFDLVSRSLAHDAARAQGGWLRLEAQVLAFGLAPLLLAAVLLAGLRAPRWPVPRERRVPALLGGALLLALAQVAALHLVVDMPWPADRTGLPLIALGTLCAVGLARDALDAGRGPWRALPAALLGALALQMAGELQASSYALWSDEAGLRDVFEALAAQQAAAPAGRPPLRVATADWRWQPTLEVYRLMHRARWMAEVSRDPPQPGGWDYLVAPSPLPELAAGAELVYTEPRTGTLLVASHAAR
jgi:hypothetical protein